MEVLLKLNNQSNGRDKIARLVQYCSRLLWHQLEIRNADKYAIDRIRNLEVTCSSFRKILRFGKCIDALYLSLDCSSINNKFICLTLTISKIANSLFLFCDHLVWLARTGFFNKIESEKWNTRANKYWLLSISMNLLRDFYEILNILNFNAKSLININALHCSSLSQFNMSAVNKKIDFLIKCHKDVVLDTIKNSCDMFIPLTMLGYTKLSPSIIGLLGSVSSIIGLLTMIKPLMRIAPS